MTARVAYNCTHAQGTRLDLDVYISSHRHLISTFLVRPFVFEIRYLYGKYDEMAKFKERLLNIN